jgi:hypothetical protein
MNTELNNNSESVGNMSNQAEPTQTVQALESVEAGQSSKSVEPVQPTQPTQVTQPTKPLDERTKFMIKNNLTDQLSLDKFKNLITQNQINFYDKYGKKDSFDNNGVIKKYCETIMETKKENGQNVKKPTIKYICRLKTFFNVMGDTVQLEWKDGEVKYTTKLNHPELQNWTSKMYWKVTNA